MKKIANYWPIALIIIVSIASRLPQLLSSELLADGDECVMGLMCKHFIEGKEFPIFFHGQAYGFALLECLPISLAFIIGGISDWGLKLPMLFLFSAAMVCFYLTLKAISPKDKWWALLITLLFICLPSWAIWSMKARGGYLTALLGTHILLWLLFSKDKIHSTANWFFMGLMLVIIYQSQPLWLPGLLPIMVYKLYPRLSATHLKHMAWGLLPASILFMVLKLFASHHWQPKVFSFNMALIWHNFLQLPALLFHHFNAWYFLYYIYDAPMPCNFAAILCIIILIVLIVAAVIAVFKGAQKNALFILLVLAVLLTMAYCLLLVEHAPRYLMPITGYMLMALFVFMVQLKRKPDISVPVVLLLLVAASSLYTFKYYTFFPARKAEVKACIAYLNKHDIQYAFSNDGLLQWQIMFYSKEHIICRESDTADRYPEYVKAVTTAITTNNAHLAVIDNTPDIKAVSPDSTAHVISHFYILLHPNTQVLHDMEFKF